MQSHVLKKGARAYFDSFSGLVPCEVISVTEPETKPQFDLSFGAARLSTRVHARVTETFGNYRKGELLDSNSLDIVPRAAVRRHGYSLRIASYQVEADTSGTKENAPRNSFVQ